MNQFSKTKERICIGNNEVIGQQLEQGADPVAPGICIPGLQFSGTAYHREVICRQTGLQCLNPATRSDILRRLAIARGYIISNYNKSIRLEDIAGAACLSVNHFLRMFKLAYQRSPHQFLTMFRLQQARYYLKNTAHTVHEIADMVGFECPSSFIRLFRNSFKMTPGQYRRSG